MSRRVRVELGDRAYEVHVGPGVLARLGEHARQALGPAPARAFVVRDAGVPDALADEAAASLRAAGLAPASIGLTPTEADKSLATLERILAAMAAAGHTRADPVVALGGGIVGDLAGFAAAAYQRGVPVVQCPTTLLAMADASVGGKTGVNLAVPSPAGPRLLKNMAGAFHQPAAVLADTRALASLPERHRRAGLAECVKHAMIAAGLTGEDLLARTADLIPAVLAADPDAAAEIIERSVTLKAEVVRRDERESAEASPSGDGGARMLLNLGHTFGHAVETVPHLSPDPARPDLAPLHHGEAVALGLVAACAAAEAAGLCTAEVAGELHALLSAAGLPTRVANLPPTEEIVARMGSDKKSAAGVPRLVLPTARGTCRVVRAPDPAAVRAGIEAMRA